MQSVLTNFFNELKEQIKSSSEKALSDFIKQQNFEQIFSSLKETVVELKNELKSVISAIEKDCFKNSKYFKFYLTKKDKLNTTDKLESI